LRAPPYVDLTSVLERDDRLDAVDEILDDVARIRARIAGPIRELARIGWSRPIVARHWRLG
jgi:hypothetical protein